MKIGRALKASPALAAENRASWRCETSQADGEEAGASGTVAAGPRRRRRGLFLAAGLAALAATTLVLAGMPARYVAHSVVAADLRLPQQAGPDATDASDAFQAQLETEIQVITSGSLLAALAGRLQLADTPEFNTALASPWPAWIPHWLRDRVAAIQGLPWAGADPPEDRQAQMIRTVGRHISVRKAEEAGAMTITAWSVAPERAASLANTLAELYVQRALEERIAATGRALSLLRGRLGQLQEVVDASSTSIEHGQAGGDRRNGDEKPAAPDPPGRPEAAVAAPGGPLGNGPGQGRAKAAAAAGDATKDSPPLHLELQAAAERSRSLRRELAALDQQLGRRGPAARTPGEFREEGAAAPEAQGGARPIETGVQQDGAPRAGAALLARAERPMAGSWPPRLALLGVTGLASAAAAGLLLFAGRLRGRHTQDAAGRDSTSTPTESMAAMDGGTDAASRRRDAPEASLGTGRGQLLRQAFTPANPQHSAARFVGRREQLARVLRAIAEERTHVCLYGERGRGKTSLANLAAEAAHGAGFAVARYSCTTSNRFEDILRGLARSLPDRLLASPARLAPGLVGCEAAFPAGPLEPWHVLALPGRLAKGRLLLVVDEFDRLPDDATRTHVADTIKLLSEHAAPVFFLVVGASDSLEQLLDRHPSVQRNIVGVQLPLLTNAEIEEIIIRGARHSGLDFSAEIRACIAALARGVPYHAQLLALRAGQAALDRGGDAITAPDLRHAIEQSIAEASPRIVELYEGLTQSERDAPMTSLLRVMASGEQDRFGRFRAVPTSEGRMAVAGTSADPALWARLRESEAVRRCVGAGADTYGFAEANLAQYVLLRMVRLVLGFDPSR